MRKSKGLRNVRFVQKMFCAFLLIFLNKSYCQEIIIPDSILKPPGSKCFWSYSIERISTLEDSSHRYNINFSLCLCDSSGIPKHNIKIYDANVKVEYIDKGKRSKVFFAEIEDHWIADFVIHTNKPLVIMIIAKYNKQKRLMKATLNNDVYPGE